MATIVEITDPADPRLADYRDLRDVDLRKHLEAEHGLFLAEGEKVVRRAVAAGYAPRSFLMAPRWLDGLAAELNASDVPCYVVSEALAEEVTGFHVHRGALASMHRPELPSVAEVLRGARRVVVLEDIVDHTNVGAIFRAVAGLGADAVLVTPRCADPLYRRSVRVSMAAVLQIPWTRLPEWPQGAEELHAAGFEIAALALDDGAVSLDAYAADPPERVALLFGTEGDGLSRAALANADRVVTIPMQRGIDSLNVAAASAVALWALRT